MVIILGWESVFYFSVKDITWKELTPYFICSTKKKRRKKRKDTAFQKKMEERLEYFEYFDYLN